MSGYALTASTGPSRPGGWLITAGWAGAALIAGGLIGALFVTGASTTLRELAGVAAGALGPAVYLGLTARSCAGPTGARTVLALLSKFTGCLLVAAALSTIGLVGALGFIVAVFALAAAAVVAAGTAALRHGWVAGVLPLLAVMTLIAAYGLTKSWIDTESAVASRAGGLLAAAIGLAALVASGFALRRRS
jgi:hypothetical protein